MKKIEESRRSLRDTIKQTCNMGVPKEEKEKGPERSFKETMAENFPDLREYMVYKSKKVNDLQVGYSKRNPHYTHTVKSQRKS